MAIKSFADKGTEDVFDGVASKAARKVCPQQLWNRARKRLDDINEVRHYSDLRTPRSNKLHPLKGDREGQWAIAVSDQYRICFRWEGTDAFDVEITAHYE
ncbi:MAG: type II toxin-antitoxin system RelE/ParE family toxin [bacterium]